MGVGGFLGLIVFGNFGGSLLGDFRGVFWEKGLGDREFEVWHGAWLWNLVFGILDGRVCLGRVSFGMCVASLGDEFPNRFWVGEERWLVGNSG